MGILLCIRSLIRALKVGKITGVFTHHTRTTKFVANVILSGYSGAPEIALRRTWNRSIIAAEFAAGFRQITRGKSLVDGVVAQLVERLVRNEKVRGSTPLGSTILR